MSFPPFQVQEKKTWNGNLTTGIEQKTRLDNKLLNSKADGFGQMPSMSENWVTGDLPKHFEFLISALTDDSQMNYKENDLLFFKNPNGKTVSDGYPCYALQNLNFALERTQRNFLQKLASNRIDRDLQLDIEDNDDSGVVGVKRKLALTEGLDKFPLDASTFSSSIHLAGVMYSANGKRHGRVRKRSLGITMEGRVKLPNIFGPVSVGDQVGLLVKKYVNPFNAFVGLDGTSAGEPTPGSFLQVRGHYEPFSAFPFHSTQFNNPSSKELDYWDLDARIRMRKIGLKNGVLNWDNALSGKGSPSVITINYPQYNFGYYIPLGFVQFVDKTPTQSLIDMAHRSFQHYGQLLGESSVEVQLNQHAVNQLNFL